MRKLVEATAAGEALSWSIALKQAAGAGRHRMPIAMVGIRYKGKQKIDITPDMLRQVAANFRRDDRGEVPVDYEHGILDAPAGQPVPASGWIKAVDEEPDAQGILWGDVEWTDRAAQMIAAKEYRYISPVIEIRRDNKTGALQGWTLTSAALTNTPVLQGMPALVLSERGWQEIGRGDAADEGGRVKVTKLVLADRAANTVRVTLDDGTEAVVKLEGLEEAPKVLRLSDVERDAKGRYDFASLDGELIAGEVFRAQQAQTALDGAIAEGKILPAQRAHFERLALSDPKGFGELVASMKPQVDLKVRGTAAEGDATNESASAKVATAARARIAASEGKKLDYAEAMRLVLRDDPKLADEYKAELAGKEK